MTCPSCAEARDEVAVFKGLLREVTRSLNERINALLSPAPPPESAHGYSHMAGGISTGCSQPNAHRVCKCGGPWPCLAKVPESAPKDWNAIRPPVVYDPATKDWKAHQDPLAEAYLELARVLMSPDHQNHAREFVGRLGVEGSLCAHQHEYLAKFRAEWVGK